MAILLPERCLQISAQTLPLQHCKGFPYKENPTNCLTATLQQLDSQKEERYRDPGPERSPESNCVGGNVALRGFLFSWCVLAFHGPYQLVLDLRRCLILTPLSGVLPVGSRLLVDFSGSYRRRREENGWAGRRSRAIAEVARLCSQIKGQTCVWPCDYWCSGRDLNPHSPSGPLGPQPSVSANSTTRACRNERANCIGELRLVQA